MSVLPIILERSKGKDLEIMNGAGDYLLHTMVRNGNDKLVKLLVEKRPEMLYWENATGMTVMDVAEIAWLRGVIDSPPELDGKNSYTINQKHANEFVDKKLTEDEKEIRKIMDLDKEDLEDGRGSQWYMHRLLQKLAEKYPGKRKLVSVFDANEVAKRLAKQQQKANEENRRQERMGLNSTGMRHRERFNHYHESRRGRRRMTTKRILNDDGQWVHAVEVDDEVERWMGAAKGFPKADLSKLEKELTKGDKGGE